MTQTEIISSLYCVLEKDKQKLFSRQKKESDVNKRNYREKALKNNSVLDEWERR